MSVSTNYARPCFELLFRDSSFKAISTIYFVNNNNYCLSFILLKKSKIWVAQPPKTMLEQCALPLSRTFDTLAPQIPRKNRFSFSRFENRNFKAREFVPSRLRSLHRCNSCSTLSTACLKKQCII